MLSALAVQQEWCYIEDHVQYQAVNPSLGMQDGAMESFYGRISNNLVVSQSTIHYTGWPSISSITMLWQYVLCCIFLNHVHFSKDLDRSLVVLFLAKNTLPKEPLLIFKATNICLSFKSKMHRCWHDTMGTIICILLLHSTWLLKSFLIWCLTSY